MNVYKIVSTEDNQTIEATEVREGKRSYFVAKLSLPRQGKVLKKVRRRTVAGRREEREVPATSG